MRATDAANPDTAYAPVPENGSRLRLLAFPAPFSGQPLTIGFKQSIAARRSRWSTGGYGKIAGVHAVGDDAVSAIPPGGRLVRPLGG